MWVEQDYKKQLKNIFQQKLKLAQNHQMPSSILINHKFQTNVLVPQMSLDPRSPAFSPSNTRARRTSPAQWIPPVTHSLLSLPPTVPQLWMRILR